MTRDEIRSSILFLLEVIEGDYLADERESKLSLALDRLALAQHYAEYTFDETDYPDAPQLTYDVLRDLISVRFPDCGYYNVAADITTVIGEGTANVGDAIDDICDIASDLYEVRWCWENTSINDALWHFKQGFWSHWGRHLRELQLYLYAKPNGW